MQIHFYDDPLQKPRPREEVKFNQLGLYVHEGGRRVSVGFDITPFLERPSINVIIRNSKGVEAASLEVIEADRPNFNLMMHLRDTKPTEKYDVEATLYYASPGEDRMVVDEVRKHIDSSRPGEY